MAATAGVSEEFQQCVPAMMAMLQDPRVLPTYRQLAAAGNAFAIKCCWGFDCESSHDAELTRLGAALLAALPRRHASSSDHLSLADVRRALASHAGRVSQPYGLWRCSAQRATLLAKLAVVAVAAAAPAAGPAAGAVRMARTMPRRSSSRRARRRCARRRRRWRGSRSSQGCSIGSCAAVWCAPT